MLRGKTSRGSRRTLAAVGATLAALAASAAGAHAGTTTIVPEGSGLTEPGGVAVAPDGSIWVADDVKGVCQVIGSPPALVEDGGWCGVEPRTQGPSVAYQMAFSTAGDGSTALFVAEGSSHGGGVWRVPWDPATGRLDASRGQRIVTTLDDRVFALAVTPAGDVDFTSKRDPRIHRILNAATCTAPCTTDVVGVAQDKEALGLAHLGDPLYLAEGKGLTTIATPNVGDTSAVLVPGFPAGPVGGVAADGPNGRIYASTRTVVDDVLAVVPAAGGAVAPYASGFSGVSALAVRSDGGLLVGDDPAAAAGSLDVTGQGRLFFVPLQATDRPVASIVSAPPVVGRDTAATFAFEGPADATFTCTLDGAPPVACGSGPSGSFSSAVEPGRHTFTVRAERSGVVGPAATWAFTVDTLAPTVAVDNTVTRVEGRAIDLSFSASEPLVDFSCSLDGAEPKRCASPMRLTGLSYGDHTIAVTATDRAGNTSAVATWRFTLVPAPPKPSTGGSSERPAHRGAPAGAVGPAERVAVAPSSSVTQYVPCVPVAAPLSRPAYRRTRGGGILVHTRVPTTARWLKLTLRHRNGPYRGVLQTLAKRRVVGGSRTALWTRLAPSQSRRLRSNRYRLGVSFGTCPSTPGAARRAARSTGR